MLKKIFPLAFGEKKDILGLIVNILIHVVVNVIAGFVIGVLGFLPLIGWVFGLLGSVLGIYFTVSLVISFLHFFKILN
jgi:hypothetical protein